MNNKKKVMRFENKRGPRKTKRKYVFYKLENFFFSYYYFIISFLCTSKICLELEVTLS